MAVIILFMAKFLERLPDRALIDGEWVAADDGRVLAVENPSTGERVAEAPLMGAVEAERAVTAAARALPAWRAKTGKERGAVLMEWHRLVVENAEALARLMTLEQGKPLAEARGEVLYGASFCSGSRRRRSATGGRLFRR